MYIKEFIHKDTLLGIFLPLDYLQLTYFNMLHYHLSGSYY